MQIRRLGAQRSEAAADGVELDLADAQPGPVELGVEQVIAPEQAELPGPGGRGGRVVVDGTVDAVERAGELVDVGYRGADDPVEEGSIGGDVSVQSIVSALQPARSFTSAPCVSFAR